MPSPERRRQRGRDPNKQTIPEWAQQQRERDIAWIVENMHVFEPAARAQLVAQGPGAIVVDKAGDADTQRMVSAYDPVTEFVLVMLKPDTKVSTYQIQFPAQQEIGSADAPNAAFP